MTIDIIAERFETVLHSLAHAGWQAAILAGIVLVISFTLRERLEPRWRFCLWLLVLIRLALPVIPSSPVSVFQLLKSTPETVIVSPPVDSVDTGNTITVPAVSPAMIRNDLSRSDVAHTESVVVANSISVNTVEAIPARNDSVGQVTRFPTLPLELVLGIAWLTGVLVLLIRYSVSSFLLIREMKSWREIHDPALLSVLRQCLHDLPISRKVRLVSTSKPFGPATCGVFKPAIVIPENLLVSLSTQELRLVLLHELMHIRRWDVLTQFFASLVASVHWFNPAGWLALYCLRKDRELACDAAVLNHLNETEQSHYGHTLLHVAKQMFVPACRPGLVGALVKDHSLVRRIVMIAKFQKPGFTKKLVGGFLIIALATIGLTDAGARQVQQSVSDTPQTEKNEPLKNVVLKGKCEDEAGKAINGVHITLYRMTEMGNKAEKIRNVDTGADGRFEFRDLPPITREESDSGSNGYYIAATKAGRGSQSQQLSMGFEKTPLTFSMAPSATLQGRVTGPDGKPVAGALVWFNGVGSGPLDGVCTAKTDADGHYAITDMTASDPDQFKPKPNGKGLVFQLEGCYFNVRHPDFAAEMPMFRNLPQTVNVVLQPAGIIKGKVIDRVTGKPAAGVTVSMQGIQGSEAWNQTTTSSDGSYRITSVKAGKYNLYVDAPNRVCVALDSIEIQSGKTFQAPDLSLLEGSWLEGRIVDAVTGKPINGESFTPQLMVGLYGPSSPKSGSRCWSGIVNSQGQFRIHVAPGLNYPYLMDGELNQRIQRGDYYYEKGVDVKAGEVVAIEFRILPSKPLPNPEPSTVRLAIPVEAEREAAATIRRLGGWYKVDDEKHVVQVNMVYHQTAEKRRYDNSIVNTDEALRTVGNFPRLKELMLKNGQATDDGLKTLTKLNHLEVLYVWDAVKITDVGIAHLSGLKNLKEVHFSNSNLTDKSLAVFSQLPAVNYLELQGNNFDDEGLKHLAKMKNLRSLWIGNGKKTITDRGAKYLATMTSLEGLDLQGYDLTDAGVIALKDLKELQNLFVNSKSGAITDACIDSLTNKTKLKKLLLTGSKLTDQGVERLLALKELKVLYVGAKGISVERQEELKKRLPGLAFER